MLNAPRNPRDVVGGYLLALDRCRRAPTTRAGKPAVLGPLDLLVQGGFAVGEMVFLMYIYSPLPQRAQHGGRDRGSQTHVER